MISHKRALLAIAVTTMVTVASGWPVTVIWSLFNDYPMRAAAAEAVSPFVNIEGTRLIGADEAGRPQWELQATSLQMDQSRSTIALTSVLGWLYRAGVRYIQVRAPQAIYFSRARTVELSGGVQGSAPDGRTFSADRVRWTATGLVATGGITLTQAGMTIRAERMSADAALDGVTFEGHVAITFHPQ